MFSSILVSQLCKHHSSVLIHRGSTHHHQYVDYIKQLKFGNNKESLYSFPDMNKDKSSKDSICIQDR
jgi:hypothetical protein